MAVQESKLVITIDSRNVLRDAQAMRRELESLDKTGQFASKSMDQMSVAIRQLAGYTAGLITVSAAINKMDAYTGMQNRLKLVTESQEQLNQAMGDTFGIAQKSYQSWDSVIQVYQRFSDNAKTLKIDMAKTAELTETVSKAVAISGASTQAAEAALTQFGQALASGTLRGEELNSILEQTPALAKAIAQGMGITVGQLRSVAAEGKITGQVLVDALTKSRESVDKLFAKTDITIGQSLQLLSNEVTKFTGEAGKASGAATTLAEGVRFLSSNLDSIANIAVVGGVALLTKTILAQTVAIKGAVTETLQRRAADTALLQSQVQLAAVEVQRTRQVTALTLTEINLARQELNSATTRQARAAATMRLTQAEIAHNIALKQSKAAVATQTAAENALNASRSRGAMLLGLVGGPIGALTIGVGALTAGYMYLQSRTAEANAKLEEQAAVAQKTDEELRKLAGNDKVSAINDLTAAFESQNKVLSESKKSVDAVLFAIRASSVENEKVRKITEDARNGVISYTEAIKLLNNEKVSTDLYDRLKEQTEQYDENSKKAGITQKALALLGRVVELTGNAAQDAVNKHNSQADAIDGVGSAAARASKQLADYNSKIREGNLTNLYETAYMDQGYSPAQAKALVDAQRAVGLDSGILSEQQIKNALESVAIAERRNKLEESYNQRQKASTKASRDALSQQKKDAKEAERLAAEQYDSRERIAYKYADRNKKIETDLANEIKEIQEANFAKPEQTQGFIENAKRRAGIEKELYAAQLAEQLNDWQDTEEEKLDRKVYINELLIQLDADMHDDVKKQAMKSLVDRSNHELGLIKLAKETRIFQAEQAMMTEIQRFQKRYQLEREEIIKTANLDVEERTRRLNALNAEMIRGGVGNNFSDPNDQGSQFLQSVQYSPVIKSNTQRLDEEFAEEQAKMLSNFEKVKELNAGNHEALLEAERQFLDAKQQLQDEYDFKAQDARRLDYENQLNMYSSMISMTSGVFGELMGIVSEYKEENTKTYKTMFALQKAAALAQAIVSTELAATQVMADPTALTMSQKMLYAGIIRTTGYMSAGIIAAQMFAGPGGEGYSNGGFTGIGGKFDPAGIVHKGEVVWSQEDIKRWGGVNVVEAMRTSQPPKGYSDGGLVTPKDTYRVGMGTVDAIERGANVQAERQAQANVKAQAASPQPIESNIRVGIFDDRDDMMNQMYGRDGEKIVMYHLKRNGMLKP